MMLVSYVINYLLYCIKLEEVKSIYFFSFRFVEFRIYGFTSFHSVYYQTHCNIYYLTIYVNVRYYYKCLIGRAAFVFGSRLFLCVLLKMPFSV